MKSYWKPRIEIVTFLLDNVKFVVPECGCNEKRARAFLRINQFGGRGGG